ncbi:hypothetical protein CGMCC3_g18079 [Colletotrichum fructicola]|nr:uncharacterized protein CGMCC3_g18079 [Colletotrichum fructicola]KAE9565739.1 hypothetical protein CGMCC3_g18079 [Colletotrichum fructicola]
MSRYQIPPTPRTACSPRTPDSLLALTGRRSRSQITFMDFSSNIPLDAQPSSPTGAAGNRRPPLSAPDSVVAAPSDVSVTGPTTQQDQPAAPVISASAPADLDNPAAAGLYQCSHCKRRYSRPAYLARHIRTYTLGRRCACPVCSKEFTRTDLLKRHVARHAGGGQSHGSKRNRHPGTSPNPRRVSYACRRCASSRVKCDEVKPCTRCCSRNVDCEPSSSRHSSTAAMHLPPPGKIANAGDTDTKLSTDCPTELHPPQQPACLMTDPNGLATLGQQAKAGDGHAATLETWSAGPVPDAAHVIDEIGAYWSATTSPTSTTMRRGVLPETGPMTVPEPGSQPVLDFYAGSSLGLH